MRVGVEQAAPDTHRIRRRRRAPELAEGAAQLLRMRSTMDPSQEWT